MTYSLDSEVYLLNAPFDSQLDENFLRSYVSWNLASDLTMEDKLHGKVRPVPYTPLLLNTSSDDKVHLWASDSTGKLNEVILCGGNGAGTNNEPLLLNHSFRTERIDRNKIYQLTFPPLNVLAQFTADLNENNSENRATILKSCGL